MAMTLPTASRNVMCDALVDLIDGGSSNGYMEIGTASMASVLVTCNFSDPAFGASSVGVATANTISNGTVANAGTAEEARIRDSDDTDIITGMTVGTSSSYNVQLTSTALSVNDEVSFSSGTITVPAS